MLSASGTIRAGITNDPTMRHVGKTAFDLKVVDYQTAIEIGRDIKNDVDNHYKLLPLITLTEEQVRLNEYYDDVMWVCTFPQQEDEFILAAYNNKRPVGLLGLSAESKHIHSHAEIKYIVAHPEVSGQGCGKTMLEKAVEFSYANGKNGRLVASNTLLGAESIYKKWGFENEGGCMTLDPSSSRKWEHVNGCWLLDTKVSV